MGEGKSNSDNGEKQNRKLSQQEIVSNYVKKVIGEMNEQYKNTDEGGEMEQLLSGTTGTSTTTNTCDNYVQSLTDKVTNINILRFELDRLPLDFKARAYFENDVKPLTDTLYTLGLASLDFSATAASLANTNFGSSSKIKDAIDLVHGVNEISDDLIKVLRCKVDNMLKLAKYDCK
ncbi:hypothetical protein [Clostridium psychrophilum]|uniref:hypothetical protein n=1 Tax=Clostridium psychrophilum TaxID=132926 RepID=UPI001C0E18C3|nr:hypothetical protein [Clostridium psychrophilum]MBU3180034.1 hypothetical protein [Clostridium psychrophilum]